MKRALSLFLAAAASFAALGPSAAADRPRSPMQDLKTISDMAAIDAGQTVDRERRRTLAREAFTPSDRTPWAGGAAACAEPRNQYLQDMGLFMARHTQPVATDRFAPRSLRSIGYINSQLRYEITGVAKRLPPEGKAIFLLPGESLANDPRSWDEALRQRAEWTTVLDAMLGDLDSKAQGRLDYEDNYIAGLWTLMTCDFRAQDASFLKRYAESGAVPSDERTRKALDLLQSRAAKP
jgi:hypothetical protein